MPGEIYCLQLILLRCGQLMKVKLNINNQVKVIHKLIQLEERNTAFTSCARQT